MPRLDSFLRLVVDQKASDLHFMAGSKPVIRHHGELVHVPFRVLNPQEARRFLYEIMTPEQREIFERDQEVDFAYDLPGTGRFRGNVFMQSRGIGGVFRVIPELMPELDRLDLPRGIRRLLDWNNGLVLFTGPTGCGKSTTQAALIHEINKTRACHIITVEDPIEFVHKPIRAVITQRQVGKHVRSFQDALRSALREAPDVLLVGEMRDLETIQLAISAAETGVLVLGTLHTGSAAQSIDRIVDAFSDEQNEQIRGVLSVLIRAVVSQRLVRLASGEGQAAAVELLFNSVAVANLIREQKSYQIDAILQNIDMTTGMQSLDRALVRLVKERRVTAEEAVSYARFPQIFLRLVEDELREEAAV